MRFADVDGHKESAPTGCLGRVLSWAEKVGPWHSARELGGPGP